MAGAIQLHTQHLQALVYHILGQLWMLHTAQG